MALNFPANPVDGDVYESYIYDSATGGWRSNHPYADTLPAGAVIPWSTNIAPPNWLLCDGSAVSRTTYASLYSVIGITYGAGDGSTTFNLPDMRGRTLVGRDITDSDFLALGQSGGAKTHTLTVEQMPSHNHNDNGHSHGQVITANAGGPGVRWDYRQDGSCYTYPQGVNDYTAYASITSTGGGQAHNNLQPYEVMNYIIKTTFGTTPEQTQEYDILATYNSRLTTLEQPGRILQVITASSGQPYAQSVTGGTFFDFPNNQLRVQITPRSVNSKFLLIGSVTVGGNSNDAGWRFTRNGSVTGVGNANGSRQRGTAATGWLNGADTNHTFTTVSNNFLDAPATTSQVTYNIQVISEGSITYLNRTGSYGDSSAMYNTTMLSSLTVMEVAG